MNGDGFFTALRKYAQFSGRSRRSEFWWFVIIAESLIILAATFGAIQLNAAVDANNNIDLDEVGLFAWLFLGIAFALWLVFIIPLFSVTVRRLHDTGASGAWALFLIFLPIVVWIMALFDGTEGPNKYGPDPKGRPGPHEIIPD